MASPAIGPPTAFPVGELEVLDQNEPLWLGPGEHHIPWPGNIARFNLHHDPRPVLSQSEEASMDGERASSLRQCRHRLASSVPIEKLRI
jgi:hypothetical protein